MSDPSAEADVKKPEPPGAKWRDILRWFCDVFSPAIKTGIGPVLASGSFIAVGVRDFVKSSHLIPGWRLCWQQRYPAFASLEQAVQIKPCCFMTT